MTQWLNENVGLLLGMMVWLLLVLLYYVSKAVLLLRRISIQLHRAGPEASERWQEPV